MGVVGDRDVLFLKRHCQGESLDIGWSGRADRETISRSGVLCINVVSLVWSYRSVEAALEEEHTLDYSS